MEGWILSWVSAPHGVRVQEEGLRCARSAQSTVDVFTTSSDTILFRTIFKGVAAPSPLQVDVQLRRFCQVIAVVYRSIRPIVANCKRIAEHPADEVFATFMGISKAWSIYSRIFSKP